MNEIRACVLIESLITLLDLNMNKEEKREYLKEEIGFTDEELNLIDKVIYSWIDDYAVKHPLIEFIYE